MQTHHAKPFAVLFDLNLQVRQGEFFGLLGPSGCGKSTLLNLLAGLDVPDAGEILLPQRTNTHTPNVQGPAVAYMQQKDLLLPWYSVRRNVLLGAEIEGYTQNQQRKALAMALLKEYGLDAFADAFVHQLSGGMRQRVALIRTMLLQQPVLLLDEPFASLDAITRREMQAHMASWHRQQKQSVMLVTHDVDEALSLCHRIGLLDARTGHIARTFEVRPLEERTLPLQGAKTLPSPQTPTQKAAPKTGQAQAEQHWHLREEILQALASQRGGEQAMEALASELPSFPPAIHGKQPWRSQGRDNIVLASEGGAPIKATQALEPGQSLGHHALPAILLGFMLLALWEGVVRTFGLPHYILPAPSEVALVMYEKRGIFASHAAVTLGETLLGMGLGTVVGLSMGTVLFMFPLWRRALQPFLIISQNTPVFAIAPLLVVWFGYGPLSKVVMAAIVVFFPITMAVLEGMRKIDSDFLRLFQTMGASPWQQLLKLRIPAALPAIFAGLRLSAVYASLGAVLGEWVGAGAGLGYLMLSANAQLRIAEVFGAIMALAPMSLLLLGGLHWLERLVIPWHVLALKRAR